eukprot:jgi/Psemu1/57348/gm1.57348_g
MFLPRTLVVLMTTGLSCRKHEYSSIVTAFSASSLPLSRQLAKQSSVLRSLNSADSDDETISHLQLLDESVLLYSMVAQQNSFENNNKEIETLRKNELTLLIEDVVFNERGLTELKEDDGSTEIIETEKEPETLDEISRALDQQIFLGYQSEFTEEALEQWVGQIDILYEKLQSQAAALPPSSSTTDTSTTKATTDTATAATTTTPFDRLRSRLESMRTLIDPAGNKRWQPSLVRLVAKQVTSLPTSTPIPSPMPPPIVKTETRTKTKATDESTAIETPLKASLPNANVSSKKNENDNSTDPIEIMNEQNPTLNNSSNMALDSGGNNWVEVPVDIDYIANTTTTNNSNNACNQNEMTLSANITADDKIASSQEQPAPYYGATTTEIDGTDIVSAVVTTAALGAAAVTKVPLLVAGVALGPVIRDSIAYAKGRMANKTKISTTSLENDGNSTSGEKDGADSDSAKDGTGVNEKK